GALFFSGATALIFEVLWSRQFVTVFGNSSYAISIVLCAFMAGLGIGGWLGGRLADRFRARLLIYGLILAGVALWALLVPTLLDVLRRWVPRISLLAPDSLLTATVARFVISFAILLVPCVLMGATLPVLVRFCTESRDVVGRRVSLLYGLNTLGAAAGCFAAGYWLIDTLGLRWTNNVAAGVNLVVAAAVVVIMQGLPRPEGAALLPAESAEAPPEVESAAPEAAPAGRSVRGLLVAVAFLSGLAALSCEVLWVRYLAFLSNVAYVFPAILGTFLLGLGAGSLLCRLFLARSGRPLLVLAGIELLLGLSIVLCFLGGAFIFITGAPEPLRYEGMTAITVLLPTLLMGTAFPLICAAFTASVETVGRSVGVLYAVNTAGSIVGSLIPVFVLIPLIGMQKSLLLMAALYGAIGIALLWAARPRRRVLWLSGAVGAIGLVALASVLLVPLDLCAGVLLASSPDLGRHFDIVFYQEGRTGTAAILHDRVNGLRRVYINGTAEVPTTYSALSCFKFMGALGPLLHPDPEEVLMICFGGGVAAGTTVQFPDVKSLEVVDLESSVVEAARLLQEENNSLLSNPKARVTTHPKSSDSWVLYTREFYLTVAEHLTDDGVFVQWLPFHGLTVTEYKIILRTFQSVFPHTSMWFSQGVDETGQDITYTLLVATPQELRIEMAQLVRRLADPAVKTDLQPWDLAEPVPLMANFLCGEEAVRQFVGEGPLNTDDLPYTYYNTRHSRGSKCTQKTFLTLLESIWPYVVDGGDKQRAEGLKRELARRFRANRLLFAGRFDAALALVPDSPRLQTCAQNQLLGQSYVRKVAGYYEDNHRVLKHLAEVTMTRAGGTENAIALYERLLTLDPQNPEVHAELGLILLRQGQLQQAIDRSRSALQLDPDLSAAHNNLGACLFAAGRPDEAIVHYQNALRTKRDTVEAHANLATSLAALGRLDEAVSHYREALKMNPDYARARADLGLALAKQKRTAEAMEELERAVMSDPSLQTAQNNLGALLMRQGRLDEAVALFSMAVEMDPDYVSAHHNLARALVQLGKPEEAIPHFTAVLKLDPDNSAAQRGLAMARRRASIRGAAR
ncbi:MAG: fused MFS/spermidine synthase, partial [Planctomycetota bacterium]